MESQRYYNNDRNNSQIAQGAQRAKQARQALAHMGTRKALIKNMRSYKSSQMAKMSNVAEIQWNNRFYYIKGANLQTLALDVECELEFFSRKINKKIIFFVDHYAEVSIVGRARRT